MDLHQRQLFDCAALMWPFSKPAPPTEPRIQSLGEMIAYSLRSEVTRSGWKTANREESLVNKALGVTIAGRHARFSYWFKVECRGKPVPLTSGDERSIELAITAWRTWDDERRRSEALVAFVDAFEQIAPIEAGTAETSGSARRARAGLAPEHSIEDA